MCHELGYDDGDNRYSHGHNYLPPPPPKSIALNFTFMYSIILLFYTRGCWYPVTLLKS